MTMPETSPLPRFGIRHLLGLTAALAVASVLLRGNVLDSFKSELFGAEYDSRIVLRYIYSAGLVVFLASLGVNLFVVGCLLFWSRTLDRWTYEPGHFVAWTVVIGGLTNVVLQSFEKFIAPDSQAVTFLVSYGLSFIGAALVCLFALKRSRQNRWRIVFSIFLGISISTIATHVLVHSLQRWQLNLTFLLPYATYLTYGLLPLASLSLVSAMVMDLRDPTPRHWSHWWAVTIAFLSYLCSFVTTVQFFVSM